MIDIHCTGCNRHVLLGSRAIEGLFHEHDGIRLDVRCSCGALNAVFTGRDRPTNGGPAATQDDGVANEGGIPSARAA